MGTIDCLVLSGGGAKGAYGAGVAKALDAYRKSRGINTPICYVGTSAGALNAAVLAAADADALISFWMNATSRTILDVRISNARIQAAIHSLTRRRFFSIYRSRGLRKLVAAAVKYDAIRQRDAHLVIAATNYTRGALEAFYVSSLVDQFIVQDKALLPQDRRLTHFRPILTQQELEESLMASAAIPVFFPPVKINADWYVDGGIGNHTPTREAAYFLRYLADTGLGAPGKVYCVRQDPPRIADDDVSFRLTELLKRTLEIYHYVHTEPIIGAWSRINVEVREHNDRIKQFVSWLSTQSLPAQTEAAISTQVMATLSALGGATKRHDFELIDVKPSAPLGDTLDFDRARIKETIKHGYLEMLTVLTTKGSITAAEYQALVNQPIFGV